MSGPAAGSSSRRSTRGSRSTCPRSSTSGSTQKRSASGSDRLGGRSVLAELDLRLLRLLRTRGHWPPLERAMRGLAAAGENGIVWHAIAVAGLALDEPRRPVYMRAMRVTLAA